MYNYILTGLIAIISYFLKCVITEHKQMQKDVVELRNKIDLTHQASEIKIHNIEKDLQNSLKDLNKKIDHLTTCIDKLFEISRQKN